MTELETPRLRLRQPDTADAEAFMDIFWDPEVVANQQVTLTEAPGDLELARRKTGALVDHWASRGYGLWTVIEKGGDRIIGCVGLQKWDGWPDVELAWVLHRSRWGQGLATEAARAALDWAWSETGTDHVISLINAGDLRSMRVAIKVGETFERVGVDPINKASVHIYGVHRPHRA
jgi:RimJ/RimL family protein N-acetyltransferase